VSVSRVTVATISSVSSTTGSTALLAANNDRKAAYFFNDSTSALFLKFGATASSTSFTVKIPAASYYEIPTQPVYTGVVHGIWVASNGNAYVTEL
jgi:hypothetical protein